MVGEQGSGLGGITMMFFCEYMVKRRFGAARQCAAAVMAVLLGLFGLIETARAQKPERPRPSFDTWLGYHARFVYVATPIRLWNRVQRDSRRELELVPYDQKVMAPDLLFSPGSPYLEVEVLEVICAGPRVDVKGMPTRLFVYMDRFGSENDLGVATNRLLGQGDFVFMTSGPLGWSYQKNIASVDGSVGKLAGSGVGREEWSEQTWPAMPVADFAAFRARLANSRTCLPL